jgi:hypothetical protein
MKTDIIVFILKFTTKKAILVNYILTNRHLLFGTAEGLLMQLKAIKKYLFIFIMLFMSAEAHSQVLISLLLGDMLNSGNIEFGLEGGYNWSNIAGLDADKKLSTFNLGFYFDIRLKNQLALFTGVLVKSTMGVDNLSDNDLTLLQKDIYTENGQYAQEISYFIVPILLKYSFQNKFYLLAGPQLSLMYKAWIEFNSDIDHKEARVREYNDDDIKRIDAGFTVGFGYKLKKNNGMSFAIKYYHGLVDVYKNISGTNNSALFLEMTVPIGADSAKKGE